MALIGREAEVFAGQQTPLDAVRAGAREPVIPAVKRRDGAVFFEDRSGLRGRNSWDLGWVEQAGSTRKSNGNLDEPQGAAARPETH